MSIWTCQSCQSGLDAIQYIFERSHKPISDQHRFILKALDFVLHHNVFLFNGIYYLQRQGVAMGAKCAPSYANLFLGEWEHYVFMAEEYEIYLPHVLRWHRYIDDIMLIWQGPEKLLQDFVAKLNVNRFNLTLTLNYHSTRLEFLDTEIKVGQDGYVSTNLYRKKTAGNSLLHAQSMHPYRCIEGIPKGQYIRLRLICSTDEDFKREAYSLYQRFKLRGYKTRCLRRAYQYALSLNRDDLLYKRRNPNTQISSPKTQEVTRLVLTYNTNDNEIRSSIHKHWNILAKDPEIGCQYIKVSTSFGNGRVNYDMYHYTCCTTTHVIYLFTCHCGSKYVGKTKRPFRRRIYEHMRDIRNCNLLSAIAKHIVCMHNGHYAGSYFQGIDRIHGDIRGGDLDNKLLQLETTWIFRLNAYKSEFGLNGHLNFQAFVNK
ncbi:hypothetical protein XELAEV_18032615mg [Xenopus laevis]|uniref:GIY-YIG domain-containing protein n=1 Tax=Xenopus laevis TaxID=8355 RepID=A0A974HD78_XENLA|nr:hypothetical protein XELAEV_18032615mg [Xenopus laevis]